MFMGSGRVRAAALAGPKRSEKVWVGAGTAAAGGGGEETFLALPLGVAACAEEVLDFETASGPGVAAFGFAATAPDGIVAATGGGVLTTVRAVLTGVLLTGLS